MYEIGCFRLTPVLAHYTRFEFVGSIDLVRLIVAAGSFGVGGVYLKYFSETGATMHCAISFSAYIFGNILMIQVMRTHGLGTAIVLTAMAQILLMTIAGAGLFGERIGVSQVLGVLFAILAIWLISQPPTPGHS